MKTIYLIITGILFFAISLNGQDIENWEIFVSPEKVNDFVEGSDHIWLATNHGVVSINKTTLSTQAFTEFDAAFENGHITAIDQDPMGNTWIGTYDMRLYRLEDEEWIEENIPVEYANLIEPQLYDLKFDNDGNLWLGTRAGLIAKRNGVWDIWNAQSTGQISLNAVWSIAFDELDHVYASSFILYQLDANDNIIAMSEDSNFEMISYGNSHLDYVDGVLWYNPGHSIINHYDGETWTPFDSFDNNIWMPQIPSTLGKVFKDSDGNTMVQTISDGLYQFNGNTFNQVSNSQLDMHYTVANEFFFDQEGNSWLFHNIYCSKGNTDGISESSISETPMTVNRINKITISPTGKPSLMNGSTIFEYDGTSWSALNETIPDFPPYSNINHYEYDAEGNLWVAGYDAIWKWDGADWEVWNSINSNYPAGYIKDLDIATNGEIWVSFTDDLAHFDGTTWTHYSEENTILDDDDGQIHELVIDHDGTVWFSRYPGLIYSFDGNEFTKWDHTNTSFPNTSPGWLANLMIDENNTLWAATRFGIHTFDGTIWNNNPSDLPNLTTNDYIEDIDMDNLGYKYIYTTNKMWINDGENNDWQLWDESNSSLFHDTNYIFQNDVIRLDNNELWFARLGLLMKYTGDIVSSNEEIGINKNLDWNIFPNPTENEFSLLIDDESRKEITSIHIIDVHGREVLNFNTPSNNNSYSLVGMATGVYFVKLKTTKGISAKMIMVK